MATKGPPEDGSATLIGRIFRCNQTIRGFASTRQPVLERRHRLSAFHLDSPCFATVVLSEASISRRRIAFNRDW
jgi:hypothetical protein